jgi:hypothetical protein
MTTYYNTISIPTMIIIMIYLPFIATHQYGDTLTFKESQWEVGVGGYLVWA